MVTVKLMGRLGNQMFQIAACIGYAKKWNVDWCIPQKPEHKQDPVCFTHFPACSLVSKHKIIQKPDRYNMYDELHYADDVCLEGHFKSEKYFAHCKEDILQAFNIPYSLRRGIVSIHIRRGDYVNLAGRFPPVSIGYITNAIEYFFAHGYRSFLVFSDDIAWCRNNLPAKFPKCGFIFSADQSPLEDLQLMSCCEHNIIANSTYSWWGAWLNQNPEKRVVAPGKWFGPEYPNHDIRDLVPGTWLTLFG